MRSSRQEELARRQGTAVHPVALPLPLPAVSLASGLAPAGQRQRVELQGRVLDLIDPTYSTSPLSAKHTLSQIHKILL